MKNRFNNGYVATITITKRPAGFTKQRLVEAFTGEEKFKGYIEPYETAMLDGCQLPFQNIRLVNLLFKIVPQKFIDEGLLRRTLTHRTNWEKAYHDIASEYNVAEFCIEGIRPKTVVVRTADDYATHAKKVARIRAIMTFLGLSLSVECKVIGPCGTFGADAFKDELERLRKERKEINNEAGNH